jgi:hypothetical protein
MTMTQPIPVIPLEYEHPATGALARPTGILRISTILAWAACAIAWLLIVWVDVESVIVTGPIIALLGTMVIVRGIIEQRSRHLIAGTAHLGICLLFVVLVNLRNWSPNEAAMPFTVLGAIHVIGSGVGTGWLMWSHRFRPARI